MTEKKKLDKKADKKLEEMVKKVLSYRPKEKIKPKKGKKNA